MKDLIDRQAAVKRIQTKLNEVFQYPKTEYAEGYVNACGAVLKMLDSLPAADAVLVVRCGECKHMTSTGRCREFADDLIRPDSSDFCSCGERREDD